MSTEKLSQVNGLSALIVKLLKVSGNTVYQGQANTPDGNTIVSGYKPMTLDEKKKAEKYKAPKKESQANYIIPLSEDNNEIVDDILRLTGGKGKYASVAARLTSMKKIKKTADDFTKYTHYAQSFATIGGYSFGMRTHWGMSHASAKTFPTDKKAIAALEKEWANYAQVHGGKLIECTITADVHGGDIHLSLNPTGLLSSFEGSGEEDLVTSTVSEVEDLNSFDNVIKEIEGKTLEEALEVIKATKVIVQQDTNAAGKVLSIVDEF